MASPRRSTKRRSTKRSPKRANSWIRKLQSWRKAHRHVDGSLPSMKIAMKHCKGRSSKRSKCRKNQGRKPKSSKRRSTRRKSPKRSSKRRSTRRKSPKRSSKRRSTRRKSSKRRSPRRRSPIRKLRKYYPSFVGKRFQKFERPSSMPYGLGPAGPGPAPPASANNNAGPRPMLGYISDQQQEERLKDDQAEQAAEQKENLYADLGIEKTDSQDEIKRAYRKMALTNHPDRGGDVAKFQQIGKAFRILSNPRAKKVYDDTYKPGIFA